MGESSTEFDIVCPHCIAPIGRFDHFCPRCGRPVTAHASMDPVGQIYSAGRAYSNAMSRPSRMVLIAMWLLFGPQVPPLLLVLFLCVLSLAAGAREFVFSNGSAFSVSDDGIVRSLLGLLIVGALLWLYCALLWKVTSRYWRQRRPRASRSRGFPINLTQEDPPHEILELPTPEMSLDQRIAVIGRNLNLLVKELQAVGYRFDFPGAVLPGPESETEVAIQRIEREVGTLPLAIKLFWRQVGSVNLTGEHPDWEGCEFPDPLVVYPVSYVLDELDEFCADREAGVRSDPFVIPVAPNASQKGKGSGGWSYHLQIPADSDNPPLKGEPHGVSFIEHLDLAIRWGGFPGLARSPGHSWPVPHMLHRTIGENERSVAVPSPTSREPATD